MFKPVSSRRAATTWSRPRPRLNARWLLIRIRSEAFGGLLALDLNRKNFAAAKLRVDRRLEETSVSPALLLLAARTYASINEPAAAERTLKRVIEDGRDALAGLRTSGPGLHQSESS